MERENRRRLGTFLVWLGTITMVLLLAAESLFYAAVGLAAIAFLVGLALLHSTWTSDDEAPPRN